MSASDATPAVMQYLACIHDIERQEGVVHHRDLVGALGLHKSTVSLTLKSMKNMGLISHQPYSTVVLTEKGRDMAENAARRNRALRDFLASALALDPGEAARIAAKTVAFFSDAIIAKLEDLSKKNERRLSDAASNDCFVAISRSERCGNHSGRRLYGKT